ncbi:MAG TPA: DUF5686 family protein [Ignavibacteria bacterium]
MNLGKSFFLLILFVFYSEAFAFSNDQFTVKGKVIDKKTKNFLPSVIVRILNTNKGTLTDDNGSFQINLEKGRYDIQFSIVGYNTEKITVDLNKNLDVIIELEESFVQMKEVLVVAEDPGVGIIRRAIANKKKWIDKLNSYKFTAYSKQIINKEDSIASIAESYSYGYWKKTEGFREVIFQKRQTENIKVSQNFAMVGGIINFNEDVINIAGYRFTGPTSANALDDYSFKLLKTYESRGFNIYEIEMKPANRFKPLFDGIICIADSIYSITKVELKPNDVFKIPFTKSIELNISQRFNVYDTIFWMPVDIAINANFNIKIPGINLPAFGFKQRSILYDYEINTDLPDSIFLKKRNVLDTTVKTYDSTYWEANRVLALSTSEEKAYKSLDSTKTLDKQFKPTGPLMALEKNNNLSFLKPLEYLSFHFNRVEGYFLGATYNLNHKKMFNSEFLLGYGFSDKKWKYNIFLNNNIPFLSSSLSFSFFDQTVSIPDRNYYSPFIITLASIFSKLDYGDYYNSKGFNIRYSFSPINNIRADINYLNEKEGSTTNIVGHGLLSNKLFRKNKPIFDGKMRSLTLGLSVFELVKKNNDDFISVSIGDTKPDLSLSMELSDRVIGSDFKYIKYNFSFKHQFPTFLTSLLLKPYFSIEIYGGFSNGELPPQRLYYLEAAYDGFSPDGTFRTMNIKSFSGNSYLEAHLEHNFRTLPFKLINWGWMEEQGIEILVFASFGKSWLSNENKNYLNDNYYKDTDGWYSELGFGFSKIFLFLRTDFSFKVTPNQGKSFSFTFKIGNIL